MRSNFFILASLVLAGCIGPPDDPVAPAGEDAPVAPSPAAAPSLGAEPESAPEPAPKEAAGNESDGERPLEPRLVVVEAESTTPASVGHPCVAQVYPPCARGVSVGAPLPVAEGGPAAARLTVWWNATAPAATTRWVELRAGEAALVAAEGESPLAFEVPVEHLKDPVELGARFTAGLGGAAVDETGHFVLELVYR